MNKLALLGLVAATACTSSQSTNPQPNRDDYDDTAQAIASTASTRGNGGDVASMTDSTGIALGHLPLGFSLDTSGTIRGNRFGVDYAYTIECRDAAGQLLGVCTALTDSATVHVAWSGHLDTPNVSGSVARHGTWTIDGLQSTTATVAGDSSFSFAVMLTSLFRPSETASFSFDADARYDAIVIATQSRDVIGGSARFDLHVHKVVTGTAHDVDERFDVHAEISFHADHTATLVLDGTERYTIDLSTGTVVRTH